MITRRFQVLLTLAVVIVIIVSCATSTMAQKTTKNASQTDPQDAPKRFYNAVLQRANEGIPEEQFMLGLLFASGTGVNTDMKQAVQWYKRAAKAGHTRAQYNLGKVYLAGVGVQKDPDKAVAWWRKAAQAGYAVAQFSLGRMLIDGIDVDADQVEGFNWVERAAAQGNPQAIELLAQIEQLRPTDTGVVPATSSGDQVQDANQIAVKNSHQAAEVSQGKGPILMPETKRKALSGKSKTASKESKQPARKQSETHAIQSDDIPHTTPPSLASPVATAKPHTTTAAVDVNVPKPSNRPQKAKTVARAIKQPATKRAPRTPRGGNDNAWLYAQHPQHYSVQLVSADSKTAAERYIKRQQLGNQATYFHTHIKGKDWYYVLYGSFATREEAEAVRQRINKSARVRRFGVLQKKRCARAAQLPPKQSQEVASLCAPAG